MQRETGQREGGQVIDSEVLATELIEVCEEAIRRYPEDRPLRFAFLCGYHSSMRSQTVAPDGRITALRDELTKLQSQRREVRLQYEVVRDHLANVDRQIDTLEDMITLASQGQLQLDFREGCPE
jgi:septal ring factor EnvC (AmiA/AmiB activator)